MLRSRSWLQDDGGSTIHVSGSLDGPWTPLSNNSLGECNNPAPWVLPNGTLYIVCVQPDGVQMMRAEHISGPWIPVSICPCSRRAQRFTPFARPKYGAPPSCPYGTRPRVREYSSQVASVTHAGGPDGDYEDPFLYTDARGWHLIYHVYNSEEHPPYGHECVDSTVAAHRCACA